MAFYDWNQNGNKKDAFDNFMDYKMTQNADHERKKRLYTMAYQSNRGYRGESGCGDGCGACGCLVALAVVLAGIIILFFV